MHGSVRDSRIWKNSAVCGEKNKKHYSTRVYWVWHGAMNNDTYINGLQHFFLQGQKTNGLVPVLFFNCVFILFTFSIKTLIFISLPNKNYIYPNDFSCWSSLFLFSSWYLKFLENLGKWLEFFIAKHLTSHIFVTFLLTICIRHSKLDKFNTAKTNEKEQLYPNSLMSSIKKWSTVLSQNKQVFIAHCKFLSKSLKTELLAFYFIYPKQPFNEEAEIMNTNCSKKCYLYLLLQSNYFIFTNTANCDITSSYSWHPLYFSKWYVYFYSNSKRLST